jgi:hypothetical protein
MARWPVLEVLIGLLFDDRAQCSAGKCPGSPIPPYLRDVIEKQGLILAGAGDCRHYALG